MSQKIKVVTKSIPLDNIIPSMFLDILNDYIKEYINKFKITNYQIKLGCIEQRMEIKIADQNLKHYRSNQLNSLQGVMIEEFLLSHFKINKYIYEKNRNADVMKLRQKIQFFMAVYAEMSFSTIGKTTGGVDHATITHSARKILNRLDKSPELKKEIFMLDLQIYHLIGLSRSKLFNNKLEIILKDFKNRRGINHAV
jgi:hypothetical protein